MYRPRIPETVIRNISGNDVIVGRGTPSQLLEEAARNRGNLQYLDLEGMNLSKISFVGAKCIFRGCNFSRSTIILGKFIEAKFEGCDFSYATLDMSTFYGSIFSFCELFGASLKRANLRKVVATNSDMIDIDVTGALFQDTKFEDVSVSSLGNAHIPGLMLKA